MVNSVLHGVSISPEKLSNSVENEGCPISAWSLLVAPVLRLVLEHTEQAPTLEEASRLLKPDGILLITVPAYQWMWSQWDVALHHLRRYNKRTLSQAVEQHGFQVLKLSYMYSFLLIPVFLIRLTKSRLFPSGDYPSDFKLSTPLMNRVFGFISGIEAAMVHHASVPFGLSLVLVAKNTSGGVS
ncbi:MAG: methyltransferase domain-containing protein [Nitrospirae bacterium]|nr:methyltransferase domain-containing protein [Nitrospirota bacterium]